MRIRKKNANLLTPCQHIAIMQLLTRCQQVRFLTLLPMNIFDIKADSRQELYSGPARESCTIEKPLLFLWTIQDGQGGIYEKKTVTYEYSTGQFTPRALRLRKRKRCCCRRTRFSCPPRKPWQIHRNRRLWEKRKKL